MQDPLRRDTQSHKDRPNFLVQAIAGLSFSIRWKLLLAFLGMTVLMVGLAMIGLETLRQANARTEKLIRDQERIARFIVLYGYTGDLATIAGAIGIDPKNTPDSSPANFRFAGNVMVDRVGDLMLEAAQTNRKIGRAGMPDAEVISKFQDDVKLLPPIAAKLARLRRDQHYNVATFLALSEFLPIVNRLHRAAYSQVQIIEAEMEETAKSTALAYEASRQLVIASAMIAVGLALLLGYAFSSSLIWPVRRIGQTLEIVAKGNFDARLTVPNRDELGELADNVNATSEQLGALYQKVESQREELAAEHARSEALLYSLLPQDIAARLKLEPDSTIADSLPHVAILFADIVDFTPRAASLPPEEVVGFLNRIFSRFDGLAAQHGLEKIKTIGDAYMVAAGMPSPVGDPVHRVASMALDMQKVTKELSPEFSDGLRVRIGLHAGPVVAGVIGNNKLFYDVWGETVNTASRMESQGEPGRIQVTDPAYKELKQDFRFEERGIVDIKGIGQIKTWWLCEVLAPA